MVSYLTQLISWLLRIQHNNQPVPHGHLEHRHWDRANRIWFTHDDGGGGSIPRAA